MQVLQRLKLELSNQEYFTDTEYAQFLGENDLEATDEYIKSDMQKPLLFTVIDVLEAVANDVTRMSTISTEFSNISEAYRFIEARIDAVREKIAAIPEPDDKYSCFSLMYTRRGRAPLRAGRQVLTRSDIKEIADDVFDDEPLISV